MRARLQLALLLFTVVSCPAQVIDRMVAVVNKRVVLESELDQAARVEFLMAGKSLSQFSTAERGAVLDRLIDRVLLDQQIARPEMLDPTPDELADRMKQLRAQLPGANTDEGWRRLLGDYGLTREDLEDSVTSQIRVLRFVDLRFRGLVRVDRNAIEAYYRDKLVPQLRAQGAHEPPLVEVSDEIEKILVEQSIDEMMTRWLETLRAQAHIERMSSAPARASGGTQP